jgi:hypothetical protein
MMAAFPNGSSSPARFLERETPMRRISAPLLLAVAALMAFSAPTALAGRSWCRVDPIVSIGGTTVQVWIAIPQEFVPYVKDATEVTFYVPKNAGSRKVLFLHSGFNGKGEKVIWKEVNPATTADGDIPITITVRVRVDNSRMEDALGDDVVLPVETRVNVGQVTDAYVEYGAERDTNFDIIIRTNVVSAP